jgi:hypothetical protein
MRGENLDKEAEEERLRRKWDAMQNHLNERGGIIGTQRCDHSTFGPEVRNRYVEKRHCSRNCGNGSSPGCRAAGPGTNVWWRPEKKICEKYPHYERKRENLLDSSVTGDPERTLRHASKSARKRSGALKAQGIEASPETVRTTLKRLGYKMQGSRKAKSSGVGHPGRDAQFQHIKRLTKRALKSKNLVLSIDTKKKEVRGPCKNGGKEWHRF